MRQSSCKTFLLRSAASISWKFCFCDFSFTFDLHSFTIVTFARSGTASLPSCFHSSLRMRELARRQYNAIVVVLQAADSRPSAEFYYASTSFSHTLRSKGLIYLWTVKGRNPAGCLPVFTAAHRAVSGSAARAHVEINGVKKTRIVDARVSGMCCLALRRTALRIFWA